MHPITVPAHPATLSRLFVVEQKGLLRIIENGNLLPGTALDIQSRVQIAPVGTGPMNAGNANDERGFLGLAFHPGFNNDSSPGYRTLYTYTSEALGAGAYLRRPQRRCAELQESDLRMEDVGGRSERR